MRVVFEFGTYNARRYGKPWCAKVVNWPVGSVPDIQWGAYLGDSSGGECEIEAEPGDIVRWGQKDHRNIRNSSNE